MQKVLFFLSVGFLTLFSSCKKDKLDAPNNNINANTILDEVNKLRAEGCKCGNTNMPAVPPVRWNYTLAEVSYYHSIDMHQQKYFSHNSKDGRSPAQRLKDAGYQYKTFGENIAMGSNNEVNVIKQWLASEGHCKNMMNKNFTEMGVGRSGNYWSQLFGAR